MYFLDGGETVWNTFTDVSGNGLTVTQHKLLLRSMFLSLIRLVCPITLGAVTQIISFSVIVVDAVAGDRCDICSE